MLLASLTGVSNWENHVICFIGYTNIVKHGRFLDAVLATFTRLTDLGGGGPNLSPPVFSFLVILFFYYGAIYLCYEEL